MAVCDAITSCQNEKTRAIWREFLGLQTELSFVCFCLFFSDFLVDCCHVQFANFGD